MTAVQRPARSDHSNATTSPCGTARFLSEALRAPHQIGAIAQSGPHLAAQAAGLLAAHGGPRTVVELGPGAGAITDALHARLPAGSTLTAVEINTAMVAHLTQSRPWLNVIRGDAADLPALLAAAGLPPADLIISALPWTVVPAPEQQRILEAITAVLHPHGTFATVATLPVRVLPTARRFRRYLRDTFGCVSQTRTVWRNIPPAHLYVCRSPLTRPSLHRAAAEQPVRRKRQIMCRDIRQADGQTVAPRA